jgi:hypothetical protein
MLAAVEAHAYHNGEEGHQHQDFECHEMISPYI